MTLYSNTCINHKLLLIMLKNEFYGSSYQKKERSMSRTDSFAGG